MITDGHQICRPQHRFPSLARRLHVFVGCLPSFKRFPHFIFPKATAVFTAACFIFTSVIAPAAHALPQAGGEATAAADRQHVGEFILPASVGRITDANYAGSKRVVIVIQDLHCHPEVQKNICAILSLFDNSYGLRRVYSEGAVGRVDTSWAEAIADPATRRKAVESLLETGKLTGAEYYSILAGKPGLVNGLEDEALYTGNLVRLGELMNRRQELQEILPEIRARLTALKERYYGPEMFRLERLAAENRDGKLPSDRYYRVLIARAGRLAIDLHDYPDLKEYLAVARLQKRLDGKKAGRQLAALMSDLKLKLPYTAYRPLADVAGDPARRDELTLRLSRLLTEYRIPLDGTYPALARSLDLAERSRGVNPTALLREERALARELRAALARTGAEREIAFIADFEALLEEYLYNRITAEDYAYFVANRERFELYWKKYTGDDALVQLKPYVALCDEFYRVNLERNRRFIRNVLGEAPAATAQVWFVPAIDHAAQVLAALKDTGEIETVVAGGFHTAGLKALLRDRNISYLVITPNVTGGTAFAQSVYDGLAREQGKILSQTLQILIGWQGLDYAAGPQDYARVIAGNIDGNFIDGLVSRGLGREAIQNTIDEMLAGVRKQHGKDTLPGTISFRFENSGKDGAYACGITFGQDSFRYTTRKGELFFEAAPALRAEKPGIAGKILSFLPLLIGVFALARQFLDGQVETARPVLLQFPPFLPFLGTLLQPGSVKENPGVAAGADRFVASLGDPATQRLNEALQIIYDRKFFTEGQLKELLPKLRFKVTDSRDILVDMQPLEDGAWTIAINRVMLEEYPYLSHRAKYMLRLKLAYLIARKMDSLSFSAFTDARNLDANLAERKAVVYLRDTSRINLHPKDAALLVEFPSLMEGLNKAKNNGSVSPAIIRYEREYAGLLRHVTGGRFYGFTFIGEPEWLKLVGDFIAANREYYRHQWWSGLTLFIDHFLLFAQNLDHRDILRFLRWYENQLDYWQEGGGYVNAEERKLFEDNFPSSSEVPIPFKYNYRDRDPDAIYSGGVVERILLEKLPEEKDVSLIEETIRKIHGTQISLADVKGVYVRELGEGATKRAYYVIAATSRGCFEFVLLMAAYNDRIEDFIGDITLAGEEEALAWGGAQFANKTPVRGARIPPGSTFGVRHRGALTVSYMGHNMWDLIDKRNWKLTKEGKLYLLKRGMTTYFESVFRFGGTTVVEDWKPDNIASLDTQVGIVDFGMQREGELVYDISLFLKALWVKIVWQFPYLADNKDYIFDAFMDVFAGSPYGAAAGADLLRQALADPYEVKLPDDLRSALATYLKTGVVKYLREPGNTEFANPLGEPDWKHINDTYHSLGPDKEIIFNKSFASYQQKDAYWFLGRALGIAPDTDINALSDEQVLQALARFRRENLAVPGLQTLQLLRIWAKRYEVTVGVIRNAETYQALLRTLYGQAALKTYDRPAKEVSVTVTDEDRDIVAGLTGFQVGDVLEELIKAGAQPEMNVHIDFRKAEILLSLLGRVRGGEYPELEGWYAAARAAFVVRGGEKTVAPDEQDPAAILEAAVTENCTRLVINDRALAQRVDELAREQYVVVDIKSDEGSPPPGNVRRGAGKLSAILRGVQPGRWVRIAGRQTIIAARAPLKIIGLWFRYIDPRFRDLPVRKIAPALLLNGYVTTSEDPGYLRALAASGMRVLGISRAEPGSSDRKLFRVALPIKDTAGEIVLLDVYGKSNASKGSTLCRLSYRISEQTLSEESLRLLPVIAPWFIGMELEKDPALQQELGIPFFHFNEFELTLAAGVLNKGELAELRRLKDGEPRLSGTVFVYDERPGTPAAARHGLTAPVAAGKLFDCVVRDGDRLAKLRLIGAMKERKSFAGQMKGDSRISVTYGDDIAALMDEARIARYREGGADTFMLPWNRNLRLARAVRARLHIAGLRTGSVFAVTDAAVLAGAQKDILSSIALGDSAIRLDLRGARGIDDALLKDILLLKERIHAADPESSIEVILPEAIALKEYAAACRALEAGDIRIVVTASPMDILNSPAAALMRKGLLKKPLLEIIDTVKGVPCDVAGSGEELQAKLNDLLKQVSGFGISARMMDWYREAYTANPDHLLSLKDYLLGLLRVDPLQQGRGDAAGLADAAVRAIDDQTTDRILGLLRTAAREEGAAQAQELLVGGFRAVLKDIAPDAAAIPEPVTGEEKAEYIAYGTAFCTGIMERFAERFIEEGRPFVSDKDRRMYVAGIVKGLLLLDGPSLKDIASANDLIAALGRLPSGPLDPGLQGNLDRLARSLSAPLFRETVNRLATAAPSPRSIAELLRLLALADRDEKGMLENLRETLNNEILPTAVKEIISAA